MADFNPNAGSLPQQEEVIGAGSMPPHLPPSSMELKIRTMASDVESIGRGGGLLGLSGKISLSIPQEGATAPATNVPLSPEVASKKKTGTYILFGVLGVAALFAIGYFLPILIASNKGVPTSPSSPVPTTTTPAAPAPAKAHISFFSSPADALLPLVLGGGGTGQPIVDWQNTIRSANTNLTEITPATRDGASYSWLDFLSALGVPTANGDFFTNNFESDFTAFVYKDGSGLWPGYVLKLKSGMSPLLLASPAKKLETDPGLIYSFFIQSPGSVGPSFADAQVSGGPIRELSFANKPAAFVYGWVKNKYLVIGTSEGAFAAASSRL